jgi:parallel beta-helix repeat protein
MSRFYNFTMVLGIIAAFLSTTSLSSWGANCGDTAGGGGTRVACECGDTVITNTVINENDPVVDTVCSDDGLIIGADNITLDCDNFVLGGDSSGPSVGIKLDSINGATVKNCLVIGFNPRFVLTNSSNNKLIKNTANSFIGGTGFLLEDSSYNKLSYNTANQIMNSGGFVLTNSSNNVLSYNTSNNITNAGGFTLMNSSNNVLINNTSNKKVNATGFGLIDSSNNVLISNTSNGGVNDPSFRIDQDSDNNTLKLNKAIGNSNLDCRNDGSGSVFRFNLFPNNDNC